ILRFDSTEKVLVFHSDNEVHGAGFIANVQQIECPGGLPPDTVTVPGPSGGGISPPAIGGGVCNRHHTEIRSTLSSPNYPSPYPLGVACRYAIHIQPGFCNVEFTFIDFSLEPPTPGLPCTRDYLDIGGVRYCGQQLKGVTKALVEWFFSRNADWESVLAKREEPPSCEFTDNSAWHGLPPIPESPPRNPITEVFGELSMKDLVDSIEGYDGSKALIFKLEPPFGAAKEVIVTFVSDSFVPDKGFLASFRQVSCGSSRSPPPPPPPPRGV
ncbi:uncharacterized protein NPIL_400231, partial [Nephila pilipes]